MLEGIERVNPQLQVIFETVSFVFEANFVSALLLLFSDLGFRGKGQFGLCVAF